jgi:predicted nucleotidyltransferase
MKYGLEENIVKNIIEILAKYPEIDQAILFGSRAKGNYKPGSDIDLTLTGEKLNLNILNDISLKLDELYLPYTFDLSVYKSIKDLEMVDHIKRVGVSLYKK